MFSCDHVTTSFDKSFAPMLFGKQRGYRGSLVRSHKDLSRLRVVRRRVSKILSIGSVIEARDHADHGNTRYEIAMLGADAIQPGGPRPVYPFDLCDILAATRERPDGLVSLFRGEAIVIDQGSSILFLVQLEGAPRWHKRVKGRKIDALRHE